MTGVRKQSGSAAICDCRFSRSARLLNAADFKRVFRQARRSSDAYFTVLAVPTDNRRARLGLAISKKQVRRAVDRNRLKRLVRETFRRQTLSRFDVIVMARHPATVVGNPILIASLRAHFGRLAA